MPKFSFIGAGSFVFTRSLVRDILTFPELSHSEICLMDIDEKRLAFIERAVERIVQVGGYPAKISVTKDRSTALDGADGVICTILQGGVNIWRSDIEIPKRYGVDINVGDTRGPAGIFRALRTIPIMLDICRDMERYCPKAVLLNYTNPMAMLCKAMQISTKITVTGLCHSVQGTAEMLARWIGAATEEITYLCAGINHQAWYLEFLWKGEDAYPLIQQAIEKPEVYNEEQVRNEMFLHLDYYVTESSGHSSEYNPWFRKRPELIELYCTHGTGWNPGHYAYILNAYLKLKKSWQKEVESELNRPLDLKRGKEYAASIFNALFGDGTMYKFNGNVLNRGLIDNLPADSCVEVPILASRYGLEAIHAGSLPPQLAILNNINAACENLAVLGALEVNSRKIFHAVALDPLTSAVLSLKEIKQMVDEMFKANKDWLPMVKKS